MFQSLRKWRLVYPDRGYLLERLLDAVSEISREIRLTFSAPSIRVKKTSSMEDRWWTCRVNCHLFNLNSSCFESIGFFLSTNNSIIPDFLKFIHFLSRLNKIAFLFHIVLEPSIFRYIKLIHLLTKYLSTE